ncbi:MAG: penicillin-binding protein [Oceanicoccus sp.]
MSEKISQSSLNALKIAFTYMPRSIEVTKFEYGDSCQKVLDHIGKVREILLINDVDPDEVYGEINPENTPNSTY